jgi:uncharacterized protein (DUF1810 family)
MDYNIERFYRVQELYYPFALREIQRGRKESHWMWYIFPQLKSLGKSHNAIFYGMENSEEAKLFYEDGYLGANLREICRALLECQSNNAFEVMGSPDNIKLRSSMTLFYLATGDSLFADVLEKFYNGEQDPVTRNQVFSE